MNIVTEGDDRFIKQTNKQLEASIKTLSSISSSSSSSSTTTVDSNRSSTSSSGVLSKISQLANKNQKLFNKMTIYSVNSTHRLVATITLLVLLASVISFECHAKRTQYHEQGLHGPKSYKFGYTSGDHKNPQERHEVSDGHGHVKGWYSFIDGSGKHQVIHYEAHPKYGFKVYNHKSKAYNNGKRHYGS